MTTIAITPTVSVPSEAIKFTVSVKGDIYFYCGNGQLLWFERNCRLNPPAVCDVFWSNVYVVPLIVGCVVDCTSRPSGETVSGEKIHVPYFAEPTCLQIAGEVLVILSVVGQTVGGVAAVITIGSGKNHVG